MSTYGVKTMRTALTCLFLLLAATVTFADPRCDATLTISPTAVLPGIPALAQLVFRNATKTDQPLPRAVATIVRRTGSPTAFPLGGFAGYSGHFAKAEGKPLAPGETRVISLGYQPRVFGGNFTTHRALQTPGEYTVQMIFFDDASPYESPDPQWEGAPPDVDEMLSRSVCSSSVATLRILEPADKADAAVWKRLQELAPRGDYDIVTRGASAIKTLFEQFPTSRYLPYLVASYPAKDYEERIAVYQRVLGLPMDETAKSYVALNLAAVHNEYALYAYQQHPELAVQHAEAAAQIVENVLRRTHDPILRARAERQAGDIVTKDFIMERTRVR